MIAAAIPITIARGIYSGRILVPFAIESALSGVMRPLGRDQALWYRRVFRVPAAWAGQRILLHFGAVDWEATVFLNGTRLGVHRGGARQRPGSGARSRGCGR